MAARSSFLMWDSAKVGNSCIVGDLEGVPESWQLLKGYQRSLGFPRAAAMRMDVSHPRLLGLADNLRNGEFLIVASAALVAALPPLKNVEILPLTIFNHKGRTTLPRYAIVNPVSLQPCLDVVKSNCTYNKIIPSDIDWVEQIVIDEGRVDPEVSLFRVESFSHIVFVRRTLAERLRATSLTGLRFAELDQYEGCAS